MAFSRFAATLVLIGSIAVIGGALLFQYVGGLTPCELCLLERWPYYISIVLLIVALAAWRTGLSTLALGLVLLLFLAGIGVSAYHVGVEQHWIAGPTACTGLTAAAHSVEALKAQLMGQQPVRCDEIQWSLIGVSLAGWNLVASLILAGIGFTAFRWRLRRM